LPDFTEKRGYATLLRVIDRKVRNRARLLRSRVQKMTPPRFMEQKFTPHTIYGAKTPRAIYGAIFFTPSAFAHSFDQKAKS
jgi:hypothetical protein